MSSNNVDEQKLRKLIRKILKSGYQCFFVKTKFQKVHNNLLYFALAAFFNESKQIGY